MFCTNTVLSVLLLSYLVLPVVCHAILASLSRPCNQLPRARER
jgi:hypothetical protein